VSEPSPAIPAAPVTSVTVIEPRSGWQPIDLNEVWHYRDLLFFLALRDIKVRYKQTALGAAWAIIQPLMTMVVFTIVFGKFAKMNTGPVSIFCAAVPWALFASALTQAGNSLIGSQNLISKVYFPRLIIPVASILSSVADFCIAFAVLVAMMVWNHVVPGWSIVLLPLFVVLVLASALAVGLWLSALNVEYRDIRYVIPFLTQLWLFASPVGYKSSDVPEQWRTLYGLNPMAGVIDGFRWAILGEAPPSLAMMAVSTVMIAVLLVGGLFYFRRMEKTFADLV
jgi:lipopolysaccharide transport system permease protein